MGTIQKYDDRKVLTKNTLNALFGEFHSYLSDNSMQYASTTTAQLQISLHFGHQ